MHDLFYFKKRDKTTFNHLLLSSSGEIPRISKHLFTAKPVFHIKRYADLDSFRQQIEESQAGLHHQPYTSYKKNTLFYKSIFLGFAALFLMLSLTAMAIPSAMGCGFFFRSCAFLKGIIVVFCTALSLSSLTLGLRLRAEKEALAYSIRKTKALMAAIYARKKVRMGVKSMFAIMGPARLKTSALKEMYRETSDKINDKKDESLHLIHRIATAETLDEQEKEILLNQALEELNDQLQALTHTFRHASPAYF